MIAIIVIVIITIIIIGVCNGKETVPSLYPASNRWHRWKTTFDIP